MKGTRVSTTITNVEYNKMLSIIETGRYQSVRDFCIVAVRRLLAREYDMTHLTEKQLKSIRRALGIR